MRSPDVRLIAGTGAALTGQLLLGSGVVIPGGLLLIGGWWWGWHDVSPAAGDRTRGGDTAVLLLITAAAALLRFARLSVAPPGLMLDEGRMGLTALALLHGTGPFEYLHSMDVIGMCTTAIGLRLGADPATAVRIPSALVGTLAVPALWWALRPIAGRRIALASAAILAVSRWHLMFSRIGICIDQPVFFSLIACGCAARAAPAGASRWWIGAGLAAGAGFHAYAAGRVLPLIPILALLASPGLDRTARRSALVRIAAGLIAGAVLTGPFLLRHPEWLLRRPEEVWRGRTGVASLPAGLLRSLSALNRGGDPTPIHTWPAVPGAPPLGPLAAAFWLPGLVVLWRGASRPVRAAGALLALSAIAGGTISGPHLGRMLYLAPLAAAGAAAAAVALSGAAARRLGSAPPAFLLALLVAGHAAGELSSYGRVPPPDESAVIAANCRIPERALGEAIVSWSRSRPVYLGPGCVPLAETMMEWYAAPTLYAASPGLRFDQPAGPAELANGILITPMISPKFGDVLREVYPGGAAVSGPVAYGGGIAPAVWVIDANALRRGKLGLADANAMLAALWMPDLFLTPRQHEEALSRVTHASIRWPRIGGLHGFRAWLLALAGRHPEAGVEARRAIAEGGVGGYWPLILGQALHLQRRFPEAETAFRRSLRADDSDPAAWYGLVACLTEQHRLDEAREVAVRGSVRLPGSDQLRAAAAVLSANR